MLIRLFAALTALAGAVSAPAAYGATLAAASCSQADVQTAVNGAVDGDTVLVPAGTCTWTSMVVVPDTKGITIQGAGIDQTILIDDTSIGNPLNRLFDVSCASIHSPTRLTGFTLKDTDKTDPNAILGIQGCGNFRIDHNKFENLHSRTMWVGDRYTAATYGVIDHNLFIHDIPGEYQGISVRGNGDISWSAPQAMGSANAVYIEDNVFDYSANPGDGALDCYDGGRYVFRYNTVNGTQVGHHGSDSGGQRGTHSWEVYRNTFTKSSAGGTRMFLSRGGSGVWYDNTYMGNYSVAELSTYRSCNTYPIWGTCDGGSAYDGNEPSANGSGTHTGGSGATTLTDSAKSWDVDQWTAHSYYVYNLTDGSKCRVIGSTANEAACVLTGGSENDWDLGDNYKITDGYPCHDQNGRTTDQAFSPVYEWRNTRDGADVHLSVHVSAGCSITPSWHIQENRDFYNDTPRPGYVPYTYPHPLTVAGAEVPARPKALRVEP